MCDSVSYTFCQNCQNLNWEHPENVIDSKDFTADAESINFDDDEEYKNICNVFSDSLFHLLRRRKGIEHFISYCQNQQIAVYVSHKKKEIVSSLLHTFASVSCKRPGLEKSINTTNSILLVPKRSYVKIADRKPLCDVLTFFFQHLTNVDGFLRLRNASEVFDYITDGYSIMEPFIDFLTSEAEINQAKVKLGAKKIEAFGTLDDSAFQTKLQDMSTTLLRLDDSIEDKAAVVMRVFNYCGCSEVLPGELHDTTTVFSGSSNDRRVQTISRCS